MISNQVLQATLDGLKVISRVDLCVLDTEGIILATTFPEAESFRSSALSFADSPADSQVVSGCQFFKVFDEHQLEYVVLANGSSDDVHMVGRMAAFQIQNLLVAYKERFDKDNFIKNLLLDNLLLVDIYNRAKKTLSTILWPTETMDGAIVSGNCVSACDKNPTYVHENNPVVEDLFAQHGKTLNFVCQIITNENVYLADKQRSSDWTAKMCRLLDLDGVIVSQEGFGNPDTDLIMNCKKIEAQGVKTVIITDEYAGRDGKSQSLADADPAADAVVTGGNANEVIVLPKMDKVIGTLDYVNKIAGASAETLQPDGSLVVELQVITGATNETGFIKLSAR